MIHNTHLILDTSTKPFSHYFCVSQFVLEELLKINPQLNGNNVVLLPNSIRMQDFRFRTPKVGSNERVIFCNARLGPEKGIEHLVEAFALVLREGCAGKLRLCGGDFHFGSNSEVLESVKKIVSRHPMLEKRIEILPKLSWGEVPRYIVEADLIVLPSRGESFGMAALEALASGVPLITTRGGNLPNLVQDAAVLTEYGDIRSLSRSILRVLSDKGLTAAMIAKGKTIAQQYDCEIVANNFVNGLGG